MLPSNREATSTMFPTGLGEIPDNRLQGPFLWPGVDAAIAAEHKVPVVMVAGDDKTCAEARSWLPGVVTCQTKKGTGPQSADAAPLGESRRLITQRIKEALAKRQEIPPFKVAYPATIRWDYLPKGSLRTHNPAFKPYDNPRRVEKSGDSVEVLLIGK